MAMLRWLALGAAVMQCAGCAPEAVAWAGDAARPLLIRGVPHLEQRPDFCGEACAAMALRALGHPYSQEEVFVLTGVDPALGRGAHTPELVRALERIGFAVGDVWHRSPDRELPALRDAQWRALLADLADQVPSIVCMHYGPGRASPEHFRLVLGYDQAGDEVIFHEPAAADGAYRRLERQRFFDLWPLTSGAGESMLIRIRLQALRVAPPALAPGRSPADYAQHVRRLREKLPAGFTVVVEPPFAVIGDEAPATVEQRAAHTVRWAVQRLKRDYFERDPEEILDIWLFRDDASYRKHTRSLFNDRPGTPYGYYSEQHRALIMNIATGGGTLVHEIVHPFMAANFERCPAWLNEGLGSLYEQSADDDGHIRGLTNWRLAGLQQAIRGRSLPSFRALTATSEAQFYGADPGTNYAQARYLLYYLQEQGLLVRYYQAARAGSAADPSCYDALQSVLGEQDMAAFQKRWERWVLGLKFPPST
ncbi:MAG: C39 family peptidase [Deltaproteobacteria bacterium]|nr:C39 family peptidase [Deltaproteobacteria bacterium]